MALPAPEETLMGVAQYNPRKKRAPVVPIRVERRAPPKVLKKPGTTEWVGTQQPTEKQKPATELAVPEDLAQFWRDRFGGDFSNVPFSQLLDAKAEYEATKAYNKSVKTYNEAIGHKTPAENKQIAERLMKKTQPKTVMA